MVNEFTFIHLILFLLVTQFWRKKVVEVAKSYPKIQFAVADEESYGDKLKELELAESGEDVNVGFFDENGRKFAMNDEFSEDSLAEFIDSCLKGEQINEKYLLRKSTLIQQ